MTIITLSSTDHLWKVSLKSNQRIRKTNIRWHPSILTNKITDNTKSRLSPVPHLLFSILQRGWGRYILISFTRAFSNVTLKLALQTSMKQLKIKNDKPCHAHQILLDCILNLIHIKVQKISPYFFFLFAIPIQFSLQFTFIGWKLNLSCFSELLYFPCQLLKHLLFRQSESRILQKQIGIQIYPVKHY